jgi:hypothetical protein
MEHAKTDHVIKGLPAGMDARLRIGNRVVRKTFRLNTFHNIETFDRAKVEADAIATESAEPIRIGVYNRTKYLVALQQFSAAPAGLTDEDLEQLRTVDVSLGERARAAKAGFVEATKADVEDNAMAVIPVSLAALATATKTILAYVDETLLTLFFRARESAARLDALEAAAGAPVGAAKAIDEVRSPLSDRIADLQREVSLLKSRCQELETRPTLKYCGIWSGETTYKPGDFVTCKGSLWHCQAATRSQPGEPGAASRAWVLAAKRGADGKDGGR